MFLRIYIYDVPLFLCYVFMLVFISLDVSEDNYWSFIQKDVETVLPTDIDQSHLVPESPLSPTDSYTPPVGERFQCPCHQCVSVSTTTPALSSTGRDSDPSGADSVTSDSDIEIIGYHC